MVKKMQKVLKSIHQVWQIDTEIIAMKTMLKVHRSKQKVPKIDTSHLKDENDAEGTKIETHE